MTHRFRRFFYIGVCASAGVCLSGCAGSDRSNPTLSITSAEITDDEANVDVRIENPGDADLRIERLDYSVIYGPLPVGRGVWRGPQRIASGEALDLDLTVPFDTPPIDPTATELEISGMMLLTDTSNSGEMSMTESAFQATAPVGN